jgi:type I restriction enzyme S subunit
MIATIDNKIKMEKLQPKLRFPEFYGDWSNYLIKEILTIGSGKDYKHLSQGEVPVFGTGGLMTKVNSFLYDGETVCIGRKGTIDKPFFHSGKIWTVDTLFYSHSFIDSLPKFVFYSFLRINWKQHNEAGGVPSLSKSTIECISIFLPKLDEQSKIASFLSSVDVKLKLLKEKKEALETYKKGMMQKIFSKELRFKNDGGNNFPDWEEKSLGEICVKKSSNISANKIEENFGEYIIYGASGILKKVDFYQEENDYISIVKDGAGVGRLLYCKGQSSVLGTMEIITPKTNINTHYLYSLLSNIDFTKYITGSTIPHIYFKDYSIEKCNIPCSVEQTKIANFLSAIDDKITLVSNQIEEMQEYKKGLLQGMFC